jgi:bacteriorhodopsin
MVFGGWVAEIDVIPKVPGFCIGMAGWLYIVYEVSAGEAASIARGVTSEAARSAFTTLRLIVTFGWTIYPIGFAIAYLCYFD